MRSLATLLLAALVLAGCASEYSSLPEPTGRWEPANPPGAGAAVALAHGGVR